MNARELRRFANPRIGRGALTRRDRMKVRAGEIVSGYGDLMILTVAGLAVGALLALLAGILV